jgi:uncharacterized membrane protein
MRIKGYPGHFYLILMLTIGALFISGSLLVPTTLNFKLEWNVPWRLSSDQHISVAAIHATLSLLMAAMIGALWSIHMRAGWRRRKNHHSGLSLLVTMVLLGLTAIGIYYFGDEQYSMLSSVAHMLIGIAIPLLLLIHIILGRRSQAKH